MIDIAIKKGAPFENPKNNIVTYFLRHGFASGKSLRVAQNPGTSNIVSVIRSTSSNIPSRMIPMKP